MRHRIVSIFSGILLLLTAACCNKEETPQLKINLADNTIQATEINESHTISFNTNQEWSISFANPAGNDWVNASPLSGKPGNHNITIQVQTNPLNKTRSQTLVIAAGTLSRSVQIEQSAAPATISLDQKPGYRPRRIHNQCYNQPGSMELNGPPGLVHPHTYHCRAKL